MRRSPKSRPVEVPTNKLYRLTLDAEPPAGSKWFDSAPHALLLRTASPSAILLTLLDRAQFSTARNSLLDRAQLTPPPRATHSSTARAVADTFHRLSLVLSCYYRFLLREPLSLAFFAFGWNRLWYGLVPGVVLTLFLPVLPFVLCAIEAAKRLNEALNPFVKVDWKLAGPGRVFFVRPDSLVASLL
jgi:hypothetical protein